MDNQKIYKINNSTITVIFGDLLSSCADVLVISGSVGLPMRGGLPGIVSFSSGYRNQIRRSFTESVKRKCTSGI